MATRNRTNSWLRRTGIELLGWTLVVVGVAALVLPGPGLLLLVAGLAVLSQQYEWAERRLEPVKVKAFDVAAAGVKTWPRIAVSCFGALLVMAVGMVWVLQPALPRWWPLNPGLWLPGGWGTGTSMIISGLIALGLIGYSYRRFRR